MGLTVQTGVRPTTTAERSAQVLDVPSSKETVRIVCISDTHGHHEDLDIPPGDILIHAGDFSSGTDPFKERRELEAFNAWLGTLPHAHKIVIAGNHDGFMTRSGARKLFTKAVYLQEESVEVMGLRIFGSPYTPRCGNGAFHFTNLQTPQRAWGAIPDDVDVLVTHGPPKGILDQNHRGDSVGDGVLEERVLAVQPRLHVFGHVHESYGERLSGVTTFVNAAAGPAVAKDVAPGMKLHQLRAANA